MLFTCLLFLEEDGADSFLVTWSIHDFSMLSFLSGRHTTFTFSPVCLLLTISNHAPFIHISLPSDTALKSCSERSKETVWWGETWKISCFISAFTSSIAKR